MRESTIPLPKSFHFSALILTVIYLAGSLSLTGCEGFYFVGGGTCLGVTPVPVVTSVVPTPLDVHELPVTMTVAGSNFQSSSKVYWDKVPVPTAFVDSNHLQVALTTETMAGLSSDNGTANISVFTAGQMKTNTVGCSNGGFSATIVIIIH
jgi:hypothetical protein